MKYKIWILFKLQIALYFFQILKMQPFQDERPFLTKILQRLIVNDSSQVSKRHPQLPNHNIKYIWIRYDAKSSPDGLL